MKITVTTTVTVEKDKADRDLVESHTYSHVVSQGDNLMYLADGAAAGLVEVGNRTLKAIELHNGVHPMRREITLRAMFRANEPHQQ